MERRTDIRPMGASEVLDLAFRVYRTLGWQILKQTAIPSLFTLGGLAFCTEVVIPMLGVTKSPGDIGGQVVEVLLTICIAFFVALPISLIGFAYTSGVVCKLVSDYLMGVIPDSKGAARTGSRALWPLMRLQFIEMLYSLSGVICATLMLLASAYMESENPSNEAVAGAVSALAIFAFMIGFFIFALVAARHSLTPPIMILEGERSVLRAIRRSVRLLRSTASHPSGYGTFGFLFLILPVVAIILFPGFGALLGIVDLPTIVRENVSIPYVAEAVGGALRLLPAYLFVWVTVPIWTATTTILYYERRIRLEGLDIEILARDIARSRNESRFIL